MSGHTWLLPGVGDGVGEEPAKPAKLLLGELLGGGLLLGGLLGGGLLLGGLLWGGLLLGGLLGGGLLLGGLLGGGPASKANHRM